MLNTIAPNKQQLLHKYIRKQVVKTLTNVLMKPLLGMLIFTDN